MFISIKMSWFPDGIKHELGGESVISTWTAKLIIFFLYIVYTCLHQMLYCFFKMYSSFTVKTKCSRLCRKIILLFSLLLEAKIVWNSKINESLCSNNLSVAAWHQIFQQMFNQLQGVRAPLKSSTDGSGDCHCAWWKFFRAEQEKHVFYGNAFGPFLSAWLSCCAPIMASELETLSPFASQADQQP